MLMLRLAASLLEIRLPLLWENLTGLLVRFPFMGLLLIDLGNGFLGLLLRLRIGLLLRLRIGLPLGLRLDLLPGLLGKYLSLLLLMLF